MHFIGAFASATTLLLYGATAMLSPASASVGGGVDFRTMVLGSGLAWGQTTPQAGTGFRSMFKTLLSADGNRVTYVGSYAGSGPGSCVSFNNVVQASPNSTIADALSRTDLLGVDKPNLVLLAVGTEDVLYGSALTNLTFFKSQLEALAKATWAQSRTSTVLLNLPPSANAVSNIKIRQANVAIAALVAEQQALSRKLVLADIYGNFTYDDISADGVWPSEKGYATIVAVLVAALRDAAARGWLEEPLAMSSLATTVSTTVPSRTGFAVPLATTSLVASGRGWFGNATLATHSAFKPEMTGAKKSAAPTESDAGLESAAGSTTVALSTVVGALLAYTVSYAGFRV